MPEIPWASESLQCNKARETQLSGGNHRLHLVSRSLNWKNKGKFTFQADNVTSRGHLGFLLGKHTAKSHCQCHRRSWQLLAKVDMLLLLLPNYYRAHLESRNLCWKLCYKNNCSLFQGSFSLGSYQNFWVSSLSSPHMSISKLNF